MNDCGVYVEARCVHVYGKRIKNDWLLRRREEVKNNNLSNAFYVQKTKEILGKGNFLGRGHLKFNFTCCYDRKVIEAERFFCSFFWM